VDPMATEKFTGSHPEVIKDWLKISAQQHYLPPIDFKPSKKEKRYRLEIFLERLFNISFSKKHFQLLRKK